MTQGPLDLFSQFRVLDPALFGTRFAPFKRRYAVMGGYGGYEIVRYKRLGELSRKIAPLTFQVKKRDCIDLPTRSHVTVPVELPAKVQSLYDEIAAEAVAQFAGGEMTAPNVLTRLLRLQQITGGWWKPDDAEKAKRLHSARRDLLSDYLLNMFESGRTHVAVCCRFVPELRDIISASHSAGYKVIIVYGGINAARRERAFTTFERTKTPTVFACQIQTGGLGRNELVVAHDAISYSLDFSLDHFWQWLDRFHRIGQKHHVTYHHLVVPDTVDEAVLDALRHKRKIADAVLKHPELIGGSHGS